MSKHTPATPEDYPEDAISDLEARQRLENAAPVLLETVNTARMVLSNLMADYPELESRLELKLFLELMELVVAKSERTDDL